MNYINKDERVKSKRQFFMLFSLSVILSVAVASAFFVAPGSKQSDKPQSIKRVIAEEKHPIAIIKNRLVVDTVSHKLAASLQKKLDQKNSQLTRLQQQINNLESSRQNKSRPAPSPGFNEINFLRLALRSQTSQVDKLKRENESLRKQNIR